MEYDIYLGDNGSITYILIRDSYGDEEEYIYSEPMTDDDWEEWLDNDTTTA